MNALIRLGHWFEGRRVVRKPEFDEAIARLQVPSALVKDLAITKARLDRIELLVGLKREPAPITIKDAPKIG